MAITNTFTNPGSLSNVGFCPAPWARPTESPTLEPAITSYPATFTNPVAAQGVTRLQSESAQGMTGGPPVALELSGDAVGATADGIGAAAKGASRITGGVVDATKAGLRGADHIADATKAGADVADAGAGALKGVARGAGRILGPLATGIDLVSGGLEIKEAWDDKTLTDDQRDQKVGEAAVGTAGSIAGGAGGAWAGAAAGAAIGSAIPIVGTVIGGIAGAVIGGFLGGKAGEAAGDAVGGTSAGKGIGGFINNLFGK